MDKETELHLVELVLEVKCKCGEQFHVDGKDEKETCPTCQTVYEVHVTFENFCVKETT